MVNVLGRTGIDFRRTSLFQRDEPPSAVQLCSVASKGTTCKGIHNSSTLHFATYDDTIQMFQAERSQDEYQFMQCIPVTLNLRSFSYLTIIWNYILPPNLSLHLSFFRVVAPVLIVTVRRKPKQFPVSDLSYLYSFSPSGT
jgi:hypothetical protein